MKKKTLKLQLNKITISKLNNLQSVKGGGTAGCGGSIGCGGHTAYCGAGNTVSETWQPGDNYNTVSDVPTCWEPCDRES